jgi:hypothetical protein
MAITKEKLQQMYEEKERAAREKRLRRDVDTIKSNVLRENYAGNKSYTITMTEYGNNYLGELTKRLGETFTDSDILNQGNAITVSWRMSGSKN